MPFLRNGNVRRFLIKHPDANRLKLASEIALGLEYLHSRSPPIWCVGAPPLLTDPGRHGDLRSLNVLVDSEERAVLADFGLSQIHREIDSQNGKVFGALPWIAPERIERKPLSAAVDVYACVMRSSTALIVVAWPSPSGSSSQAPSRASTRRRLPTDRTASLASMRRR